MRMEVSYENGRQREEREARKKTYIVPTVSNIQSALHVRQNEHLVQNSRSRDRAYLITTVADTLFRNPSKTLRAFFTLTVGFLTFLASSH